MMNDDTRDGRTDTDSLSSSGFETALAEDILELDHVFAALGHPRRRYLSYMQLRKTEWSLVELAKQIATWEHDCPEHAVEKELWEPIYVSLYHTHVPRLVDEDVVAFDEETELVRAAENLHQVRRALEGIGTSTDAAQEAHAQEEGGDDGS